MNSSAPEIVPLGRTFVCRQGVPAIDRVDVRIFRVRYFTHCMACTFCHDSCCAYGADVDAPNVDRILAHEAALARHVAAPAGQWFHTEYRDEPEFPGGRFTRTKKFEGACAFVRRGARGCAIHAYSLEAGLDYHDLKPMICSLAPITFDRGLLLPMTEVQDRTLVCLDDGPTLYRGLRDELAYYFGGDLVTALDAVEARG